MRREPKIAIACMLGVVLFTLIMMELCSRLYEGEWLKDEDYLQEVQEKIHNYQLQEGRANVYYLMTGDLKYIWKSTYPITARWHIDGIGRVPRWSKMDSVISHHYDSLFAIHKNVKKHL